MYIKFNSITIHNFLSLGDVQLLLDNQSTVLVEGVNHNPKDQATSNGSGKTSLFNAICWVLTGETLSGVSSNIVNLYGADGCFVTLDFDLGNDHFVITRTKDYKKSGSDLKIFKNNVDVSGKGIRESTKVLANHLGDLDGNLIGSIIILGQGLPHRFTNNSPAGRKELLEKLSKSDFMIEDIKSRLSDRRSYLDQQSKELSTNLASEKATVSVYQHKIREVESKIAQLKSVDSLEQELESYQIQLQDLQDDQQQLQSQIETANGELTQLTDDLLHLNSTIETQKQKLQQEYEMAAAPTKEQQMSMTVELKSAQAEIDRINSIRDVCPTCGQRLVGVTKPSTSMLDSEVAELKFLLQEAEEKLNTLQKDFNAKSREIEQVYSTAALTNTIQTKRQLLQGAQANLTRLQQRITDQQALIAQVQGKIEAHASLVKQLQEDRQQNIAQQQEAEQKIVYYDGEVARVSEHIDAINQMTTIVKRDFRGYLLAGVIEYINAKVQYYANRVFGSTAVCFSLNGNNIDISCNGKPYENLSGGEKQKVDLIVQFALKDMLSKYLNVYCNIIVLDEIFDNLDVLGCQKVLNLVALLEDVNSVYIISHHAAELQVPYDRKLTVMKDSSGVSSLIE